MDFALLAPPVVAKGDQVVIRSDYIPAAGTASCYQVTPQGVEIDITANIRSIGTTVQRYEILVTLTQVGQHLFKLIDTVGGYGMCQITVAQWATNLDQSVSSVATQKTDIQRIMSAIMAAR